MSGQLTIKQEYRVFLSRHYTHQNTKKLSLTGVINTLNYTFEPPPTLGTVQLTMLLDRILLFRIWKNDGREWLKNEYKRLSLLRDKLLAEDGDFELT